jgi:hypothetical protein
LADLSFHADQHGEQEGDRQFAYLKPSFNIGRARGHELIHAKTGEFIFLGYRKGYLKVT